MVALGAAEVSINKEDPKKPSQVGFVDEEFQESGDFCRLPPGKIAKRWKQPTGAVLIGDMIITTPGPPPAGNLPLVRAGPPAGTAEFNGLRCGGLSLCGEQSPSVRLCWLTPMCHAPISIRRAKGLLLEINRKDLTHSIFRTRVTCGVKNHKNRWFLRPARIARNNLQFAGAIVRGNCPVLCRNPEWGRILTLTSGITLKISGIYLKWRYKTPIYKLP